MAKPPSARATLGMLTAVNLLNYVDRYIPAGALPLIVAHFGVSDAKGGVLLSLFMFPYAIVSPVVGILGDRWRRFALAGAGVLVWSAATFGSGLAPTFGVLLAARVIIGVGEASYSVVTPALLGDYYPPERRARVLSFFYAALPVGSAIGFAVGGAVGTHFGWRWAFLMAGIPGAVLGVALLMFRDPPRAVTGGPAPAGTTDRHAGNVSGTGPIVLFQRRSYFINVGAQTIYTFALGGLAAWMPTYFYRVRGLPLDRASILFGGIVCVAGFTGTLTGGALSDALSRRNPAGPFTMSGVALIASLPFTLLAVLSPSPAIFWPAMFVTLTLLFLNTGPLNAVITNILPPGVRALGFGVLTMCIHLLGDALSPFLIGVASDRFGLQTPVVACGAMLTLAGVVLLAGRAALRRDLHAGGAA